MARGQTGFRYNAAIKYSAVHSTLGHEQIVAILRGFVGSRRKAPIATGLEPLLDILVHTQDICIPAWVSSTHAGRRGRRGRGLGARAPRADAAVEAAKGIRLVTTRADWAHGEGPMVEAAPRPYWAVRSDVFVGHSSADRLPTQRRAQTVVDNRGRLWAENLLLSDPEVSLLCSAGKDARRGRWRT